MENKDIEIIKNIEKQYDLYEDKEPETPQEAVPEKEIKEFISLKKKLKEMQAQSEKQKGLLFKLKLKQKNPVLNKEIAELESKYKVMLNSLVQRGFSEEKIDKGESNRSAEQIESQLDEKLKDVQEKIDKLSPEKRTLFEKIKKVAKNRNVQLAVGAAIIGGTLVCPPVAVLTGGAIQGFIPYALAPTVKAITGAAGGYVLRGYLKDRQKAKNPEAVPEPETIPAPTPETTPIALEPETIPAPTPETTPGPISPETINPNQEQPITTSNVNEELEDIKPHYFGKFGDKQNMEEKGEIIKEREASEEEVANEMLRSYDIMNEKEVATKFKEINEKEASEEEVASEMPNIDIANIPTQEEATAKFKEIDEKEKDKKTIEEELLQ